MKKLLESRKNGYVNGSYSSPFRHVTNNLSVTPSDMLTNSKLGVPISSQVDTSNFYDGDTSFSMSIDPMLRRGVDIVDAWNSEMDAKSRLESARVKDVKLYGK